MPQFTDSIVGENVAVATEYFKTLAAFSKSGGSIGFIPFNISFILVILNYPNHLNMY